MSLKLKHQLARKSIAFSLFASLVLSGCGAPTAINAVDPGSSAPDLAIERPESPSMGDLAIYVGDKSVQVGDNEREVLDNLPRPKGAYEFSQDPPIRDDKLTCRGWESSTQSFAGIFKEGRSVLAMMLYERVESGAIEPLLARLRSNFGPETTTISDNATRYLFWDRGNQRLMFCETVTKYDGRVVSVVVGLSSVMQQLRMDPETGKADSEAATRMIASSSK